MNNIQQELDELANFINDEENSILERRLAMLCENIMLGMINPDYHIHPIDQVRLAAKIIKNGY